LKNWINLHAFDLPKLTQGDIKYLNRFIASNEIQPVIKNFPKIKCSGPHEFTAKVYQTFKAELMLILLKLFHEVKREEVVSNLFYEAIITNIPKLDKDTTKKRIIGQLI
jgi:hypothetical protein